MEHRWSPTKVALPRSFLLWQAGAWVSQLGDGALYFALGWAAAAHGGTAAGLVLTTLTLARTALLLAGGVSGDRFGARAVMITGDAIMLGAAGVLAVVTATVGTPLTLLVVTAAVIGVVDAFYLPAAGSMPRRLVADRLLPRAIAWGQSGRQVVAIAGAPLGGVLVAAAGVSGAAALDAVSFGAVLVVLVAIRPRHSVTPVVEPAWRQAMDGIRVVVRTPGLGAALVLVGATAGFAIPATSLLVPLLARFRHWSPDFGGVLVGAQSLGLLLVGVAVAWVGAAARPGRAAAMALLLAALGLTGFGLSPVRPPAVLGALVLGLGLGLFVSNLSPVIASASPRSHLSRVQSLLSLVQSGALTVTNLGLGMLTRATTPAVALSLCAAVVALAGAGGLLTRSVRMLAPPG